MLRRKREFVFFLCLLCFLAIWTASADEVLVKVSLDDIKDPLKVENYNVRFQGRSFLLVQGDEDGLAETFPSCAVLDSINPDTLYYLVRVGLTSDYNILELEGLGDVIFRFGDSALLRIDPSAEPLLIALGLPLAPLPESIRLYPQQVYWTAPELKSKTEAAADVEIIAEVVNSVSADELRETISELQENRDLDPPYITYRSRFCLRVKNTDDPSDDACDNAAEYIYNKFKSYGLDVEYDPFPHEVLTQGHYEMRSVVATLPGKGIDSRRTYIISSHYDSIASKSTNWLIDWKTLPAPGADDNASGTAAVLEAARVLSQYDFEHTIKFITFSGEELGLHGSKHYTELAAENGEDIAGVLNFDMIAYDPDQPDIDVITNAASEWIADCMLSVQRGYNIGPLTLKKIINPDMVYSDHAPFWHNGWNAILGIDNSDFNSPEFYPFMHTSEDTIDKLDFDMASRMVRIAAGTLASLADPMGGIPHPDLAVTEDDIFLSPAKPGRDQPVQVTACIRNLGKADAVQACAQVWLVEGVSNTPRLITEEVFDVQAGASVQVSASLSFSEWGDYEVLIKANPDYEIFETNGQNNVAGKAISIGSDSLAMGKLMLYPNPMRSEKIRMSYTLSKDASSRMEIYDSLGNLVYKKSFFSGETGGKFGANNDLEWDGTNLMGERVSAGIYFCYVIATDENGVTKNVSRKFLVIK
jgi:hypothetical protein